MMPAAADKMAKPKVDIEYEIERNLKMDGRFHRNAAFHFFDSLDFFAHRTGQAPRNPAEIAVAFYYLGSRLFGPMANVVFQRWGMTSQDDVFEIAKLLVKAGLVTKERSDELDAAKCKFDPDKFVADRFTERLEETSRRVEGT